MTPAALTSARNKAPMAPWPYPLWIAHRGAGQLAPENTLAAFRLGARHGFRAFECDVKLSADHVPFLLHDATLEHTTSGTGTGTGSGLGWQALSRLDAGGWHSPAFAGEPLPALEAIAGFVQQHAFTLNIEIKPTPGDEVETGRRVSAEAARLWAGQAVPPLLSSFRADALAAAAEAAPYLPRALLLDSTRDTWLYEARALGCVAVVTHFRLMDAGLIATLHQAGLRAVVYTVNDAREVERLIALGIDGLITDAVDRFGPERFGSDRSGNPDRRGATDQGIGGVEGSDAIRA